MQVSHAKFLQGLSFCLILSILVITLTSCNYGNSQAVVVQETELKSTQNPATQELTLVSPTEAPVKLTPTKMATEMPTLTLTPEPTATPEATKDIYEIDMEKLHTMPPSYEDVVANPEKYQQSPDFFGDTEEAMEWWNNSLIPAMGDPRELEPNVYAQVWTNGSSTRFDLGSVGDSDSEALLSDYPSFYFFHDNELFLVPVLAIKDGNEITSSAFAVILYASNDGYIGNEGLAAIKNMAEGKKIWDIVGIKNSGPFNLPNSVKSFIESDYNWDGLEEYAMTGTGYLIGVGAITTISN